MCRSDPGQLKKVSMHLLEALQFSEAFFPALYSLPALHGSVALRCWWCFRDTEGGSQVRLPPLLPRGTSSFHSESEGLVTEVQGWIKWRAVKTDRQGGNKEKEEISGWMIKEGERWAIANHIWGSSHFRLCLVHISERGLMDLNEKLSWLVTSLWLLTLSYINSHHLSESYLHTHIHAHLIGKCLPVKPQ